jgi:hypothetical protein
MSGTPQGQDHFVTINLPAPNQPVLFNDALQGAWVPSPWPLDKSALTAVTFQVVTTSAGSVAFDFCVSNVDVVP